MTVAYETALKLLSNNPDPAFLEDLHGTRREQVLSFHRFYKQPIAETFDPLLPHMSPERIAMRLGLIIEEVRELLADGFGIQTKIYYSDVNPESDMGIYGSLEDAVRCNLEDGSLNAIEAVDALADISYVADGFAIEMGVNLDDAIDEVHASNMTKPDENGNPIYREDGKVLKGPFYVKPDIEKVI